MSPYPLSFGVIAVLGRLLPRPTWAALAQSPHTYGARFSVEYYSHGLSRLQRTQCPDCQEEIQEVKYEGGFFQQSTDLFPDGNRGVAKSSILLGPSPILLYPQVFKDLLSAKMLFSLLDVLLLL